MEFVLVGVGGALGAILRYLLGLLPYQGNFPFKTWAINLVGSFLIGWLSARLGRQAWFPGDQLLLITALHGQQPSPRFSLCRPGLLLRQAIKYQKAGS